MVVCMAPLGFFGFEFEEGFGSAGAVFFTPKTSFAHC